MKMKVTDIKGNTVRVLCKCGNLFSHSLNASKVRCDRCDSVNHLAKMLDKAVNPKGKQ